MGTPIMFSLRTKGMMTTTKLNKQSPVNTIKPHTFTEGKFEFGGKGQTRGFYVFKFPWKSFKIFFEEKLPDSAFYRLGFLERLARMTGRSLPACTRGYEKWLELAAGGALSSAEAWVKSGLGLSSFVDITGHLTRPAVRVTDASLGRRMLKMEMRREGETLCDKWVNLSTYTVVLPAIINLLVSASVGDPSGMSGTAASFLLGKMFEGMRSAAEEFFEPSGGSAKEIPPPPPPPPPTPPRIGRGPSSQQPDLPMVSFGGVERQKLYVNFPPQLNPVREGLRSLGMTWLGTTTFLQGFPIEGPDRQIVEWIAGLVKLECLDCGLVWMVPESMLFTFVLHFLDAQVTIAWCGHCHRLTVVKVSRMTKLMVPRLSEKQNAK